MIIDAEGYDGNMSTPYEIIDNQNTACSFFESDEECSEDDYCNGDFSDPVFRVMVEEIAI